MYCNTALEDGATKRVAKALVDCKVRVLLSSLTKYVRICTHMALCEKVRKLWPIVNRN